jgi:hypothetical protein
MSHFRLQELLLYVAARLHLSSLRQGFDRHADLLHKVLRDTP